MISVTIEKSIGMLVPMNILTDPVRSSENFSSLYKNKDCCTLTQKLQEIFMNISIQEIIFKKIIMQAL